MLTAFGRYLRKLRIDHGDLIKDMADKLGVTASYLSAVETGKRNIPTVWVDIIADHYQLTNRERDELTQAADMSVKSIHLDIEGLQDVRKETAILFAREFSTIDDQTITKIRKLLSDHSQEE